MRIMGVDYGDARTGIAVSDESEFLATGICTLKANGMHDAAQKVSDAAKEHKVGKIVVGLPKNMDGSDGFRVEKTKMFIDILKDISGLEIETFDERVTTMAAHQYLNATDASAKRRKEVVDTLSASIILQGYLDRQKNIKK